MRIARQLMSLLALSALVACAQKVTAPTANAGAVQVVNTGAFVRLDGTGSKDAQGRPLAYAWTFASKPLSSGTTLSDATTATPTFLADVPGDYVVQLVVSNSVLVSTPATVTITATTCGATAPVINSISSNKARVNIGDAVQLSADVTDADNGGTCNQNQTLTYAWSLIQQPAGSTSALNSATSETPSLPGDVAGDYMIRLQVKDSTGLVSLPKTFTFTVSNCGAAVPTVVATAAPSGANPNATVALTATVTDADIACGVAQTFTYEWSVAAQPSGSTPVISNTTIANPTFKADKTGSYEIRVSVTDNTNRRSQPGVVIVTINPCGDTSPTIQNLVQASGFTGTAPNGTIGTPISVAANATDGNCLSTGLTNQWTLTPPNGSRVALSDAAAATPSFTPDVPGSYVLGLTVRNSLGRVSNAASLNIPVVSCTPTAITWASPAISADLPVVDAPVLGTAANPIPHVGTLVRLTPHASVAAYCGAIATGPLTYAWSFTQRPVSSTASLDSLTAATPTFTPDMVGTYQLSVVATDAFGNKSAPMSFSIATSNCSAGRPSASITVTPGLGLFDPYALAAGAVTNPDDSTASCPARFNASPYTKAWSVVSPATASDFINPKSGDTTTFTPHGNGSFVVQLVVTSSKTGVTSAPAQRTIDIGCALPGFSLNGPAVALARRFDGTTVTLPAQIFRDDLVTLGAQGVAGCLTADTFSYQWQFAEKPANSAAQLFNATTQTPSFFADVPAATYKLTVTVTDSLGNVFTSGILAIVVEAVPAAPVVSGLPVFVTAATTGVAAQVTGVAGATYSCTATNGTITAGGNGTLSSGGLASVTLTAGSTAGAMTVSCKQFGGIIASDVGSASSTVVPAVVAPTITAASNATTNQVYTASVVARAGMTYSWSLDSGAIVSAGGGAGVLSANGSINSIQFNAGPVGALHLAVTEKNQANAISGPGAATVNVVPAAVAPLITAPQFVTAGSTGAYTASIQPRPGATYLWAISAGAIVGAKTGSSIQFTAPGTAQIFSVSCTETNAAGDSSATGQKSVEAISAPPGTLVISATTPMTAGLAYTASVQTGPGRTTTWSIARGLITSAGGTSGVTSPDGFSNSITFIAGPFAASSTVNLTATQVDQAQATSTGSIQIALIDSTLVINAPSPVTTGGTYTATVQTKPNAVYTWSVDNGAAIVSANGASGVLSADGKSNSIQFTTGNVGTITVSLHEVDGVGDAKDATKAVVVAPQAVAPIISAAFSAANPTAPPRNVVTATRQYFAEVPARTGFSYRWTITNGSIPQSGEVGTTANGKNTLSFTAGAAQPDNSPATMTLTCTETNAAGDSSASSTFSAQVYPNPATPIVTLTDALAAVLANNANVTAGEPLHAAVPGQAFITFAWAATNSSPASQAGGTLFNFTGTNTTGLPVTFGLTVVASNAIGDTATGTAGLQVYPRPVAPAIVITDAGSAVLANGANVTAGEPLTGTIASQAGISFAWAGGNSNPASAGNVTSFGFTGTNTTGSPVGLTLAVVASNAIGFTATSPTRTLNVYPRPVAPAIVITKSAVVQADGANVTAGEPLVGTITGQAGITFAWSAANSSPASQAGGTTFNFTGTNSTGSAVSLTATVVASNAIGFTATSPTRNLNVYPRPTAPAVVITKASVVQADGDNVTAGEALVGTIGAQAGITFAWSATNSSPASQAGGTTFNFTGTNTTASPVSLTAAVVASNAIGFTATSPTRTLNVYPRPVAPTIVITKAAVTQADNANVTAGEALVGTIGSQLGVTFAWTATNSSPATQAGGTSFNFTGTNTTGSPVSLTVSVVASNAIGFTATSATRNLNVYPRPTAPAVVITDAASAVLANGANVTAGEPLTGAVVAQPGITFAWAGTNSTPATQSGGVSFSFTGTNSTGSPVGLTLGVVASNAIGFTATSATRTLNVFPRPVAPAIVITKAGVPLADASNVTAGEALVGTINSQAGVTFAWAGANSNPLTAGNVLTVPFTGTNTGGTAVSLTLQVTATNGIGFAVTSPVRTLNVYPRPTAPVVTVTDANSSTVADGASVTAGEPLTASTSGQPGITFAWAATNSTPASQSGGTSFGFTGTNAGGTPVALALVASASNAIGFTVASATVTLNVYPRPATPSIQLRDALGISLLDSDGVTAGDALHAVVATQPGITLSWTGTNTSPATGGNVSPFDFTAVNGDAGLNPVTLTVSVDAKNAIGFTVSATQRTLTVYPAPVNPGAITITSSDGGLPRATVVDGSTYVAHTAAARPNMTYRWTILRGGCFPSQPTGPLTRAKPAVKIAKVAKAARTTAASAPSGCSSVATSTGNASPTFFAQGGDANLLTVTAVEVNGLNIASAPGTSPDLQIFAIGQAAKFVLVGTYPASAAAGSSQPITVRATDGNDLALSGYSVSFTAAPDQGDASPGGSIYPSSTQTDGSGTATATGTLPGSASAGSITYTATLDGQTVAPLTVTFGVVPGDAAGLVFATQPPSSVPAAQAFGVTVNVVDAFGNLVPNYPTDVTVALGQDAQLDGTKTATPNASGVATFEALSVPSGGTGFTLVATSGSLTGTSSPFDVVEPLHITSTPPGAAIVGTEMRYEAAASASGVTWALLTEVGNAQINADTGVMTWTPDAVPDSGTQTFTIQASANDQTDSQTFTVTVSAPTIASQSAVSPTQGGSVTVDAPLSPINGAAVVIPPGALPGLFQDCCQNESLVGKRAGKPVSHAERFGVSSFGATNVTISSLANPPVPPSARLAGLTGADLKAIDLGPSGTVFSQPVQLYVPVSAAVAAKVAATGKPPLVQWFDPASGNWANVTVVSYDPVAMVAVASVTHFSLFVATPDVSLFNLAAGSGGDGTACFGTPMVQASIAKPFAELTGVERINTKTGPYGGTATNLAGVLNELSAGNALKIYTTFSVKLRATGEEKVGWTLASATPVPGGYRVNVSTDRHGSKFLEIPAVVGAAEAEQWMNGSRVNKVFLSSIAPITTAYGDGLVVKTDASIYLSSVIDASKAPGRPGLSFGSGLLELTKNAVVAQNGIDDDCDEAMQAWDTSVSFAPPALTGSPGTFVSAIVGGLNPTLSVSAGAPATFSWQSLDPTVMIANGPVASQNGLSSAIDVQPTAAGRATVMVTATNAQGAKASWMFIVQTTKQNTPPSVTLGASKLAINVGETVTLTAVGSDPEQSAAALKYKWTGSGNAGTLVATDGTTAAFTADTAGTFFFSVVANDGLDDSVSANVAITVAPQNTNRPPSTPVVTPLSTTVQHAQGATATTSFFASAVDPDGDAVTFAFTQLEGPTAATLTSPANGQANFSTNVDGAYLLSVIASDPNGGVSSATQVHVLVSQTIPPNSTDADNDGVPDSIDCNSADPSVGICTNGTTCAMQGPGTGYCAANQRPTFTTPPAPVSVRAGAQAQTTTTAMDPDVGDVFQFVLAPDAPAWVHLDAVPNDASSATLTAVPTADLVASGSQVFSIGVDVIDSFGGATRAFWAVTVQANHKPVISIANDFGDVGASLSVRAGAPVELVVTVTDEEGEAGLSFTVDAQDLPVNNHVRRCLQNAACLDGKAISWHPRAGLDVGATKTIHVSATDGAFTVTRDLTVQVAAGLVATADQPGILPAKSAPALLDHPNGNRYIIVPDHRGLVIFGVGAPGSPGETAAIVARVSTPGDAQSVALLGTWAFVADGVRGVAAIDLADPTQPQYVGSIPTNEQPVVQSGEPWPGDALFIASYPGRNELAVALDTVEVRFYNMNNFLSTRSLDVGWTDLPIPWDTNQGGYALQPTYDANGFVWVPEPVTGIFHLVNPVGASGPTLVNSFSPSSNSSGCTDALTMATFTGTDGKHYGAFSTSCGWLEIVDVTGAAGGSTLTTAFKTPGNQGNALAVVGSQVYSSDRYFLDLLKTDLSVATEMDPNLGHTYHYGPFFTGGLVASPAGDRIYVSVEGAGLSIYDSQLGEYADTTPPAFTYESSAPARFADVHAKDGSRLMIASRKSLTVYDASVYPPLELGTALLPADPSGTQDGYFTTAQGISAVALQGNLAVTAEQLFNNALGRWWGVRVRTWDVANGKPILLGQSDYTFTDNRAVNAMNVRFAGNTPVVMVSAFELGLLLVDVSTPGFPAIKEPIHPIVNGAPLVNARVSDAVSTPDGQTVFFFARTSSAPFRIYSWDLGPQAGGLDLTNAHQLGVSPGGAFQRVENAVLDAPRGRLYFGSTFDGDVWEWDVTNPAAMVRKNRFTSGANGYFFLGAQNTDWQGHFHGQIAFDANYLVVPAPQFTLLFRRAADGTLTSQEFIPSSLGGERGGFPYLLNDTFVVSNGSGSEQWKLCGDASGTTCPPQ